MAIAIDPAGTALLVMDCQPGLLGFLPDPAPLLATARRTAQLVRGRGGVVGFVRVAFAAEDYAGFPADSLMGNRVKGARPNLDDGTPTAAIDPSLDVLPADILVRKTRVGAFSTTDLNTRLTDAGITTLLLAGVHTSGVVLSTVREAHDRDYQVVVVSDACADPESDVHNFLLERIFPKQGSVVTSAELAANLSAMG